MDIVLSIAGSDSSAGAGIQQDLKSVTAMGCYGATVITAITSQNTLGVHHVMPLPPAVVRSQLHAVLDDLPVRAIKTGQIPTRDVAECIVHVLRHHPAAAGVPVVCDPVMVSTSGRQLMNPDCVGYLSDALFPLCTLVTPNLPETEALIGKKMSMPHDLQQAGAQLCQRYHTAFLLKGGHADGDDMADWLFTPAGDVSCFHSPKIHSTNLHGTGCTLSSAIAAALAQGHPLGTAVERAKQLVTRAIVRGQHLNVGHGNGPLWP